MELHKLALREYIEQNCKQRQDIKKMYAVILGQYIDAMINKFKALDEYDEINNRANCARLLREVRKITYLSDEKEDPFMSAATTSRSSTSSYRTERQSWITTTLGLTWLRLSSRREEVLLTMNMLRQS